MASTLHAYSVRVHRLWHPEDERCLGDLLRPLSTSGPADLSSGPAPVDLLKLVQMLMPQGLQWPPDDVDNSDRHGSVESLQAPDGQPRRLHGRLLVGQSGVRSDLRQERQVVRRQPGDVEERPLYFLLNLPQRSTRGLLLVERHGHLGVQQAFWNDVLIRAFRDRHPDLALKLEHFYPADLFQEYDDKQGRVNGAVVVAALHGSSTGDDLQAAGSNVETVGSLQIGVRRSWRALSHDWGRALLGLSGGAAVTYVLPEGPEADLVARMQTDEVRVQLQLNDGTKRNVVLGHDYAPRAGYTLPDVGLDEEGYPDLGAMLKQALGLEPTLLAALGVS